jgi:membrane protein YdbS with pleckstrin-like domain
MSTTDPDTTDTDATASTDDSSGATLANPDEYEHPEWLSLDPDEEVVWVGEPVLLSLVGTAVVGVVLIPVLVGLVILLALPFSYLAIKNTDFVVTTKSLYVKKGVLSTNIETVDIDKIQNTEYNQSFWGKQFDYANIDISTAGSAGADITFQSIENARAVRERISELGNRGRSGRGSSAGDEAGERARDDRLDELVAELRATREAMERIEAKLDDGRPAGGSSDGADGAGEEWTETEGSAGRDGSQ